jgi:hypothetical protein
MKAIEIIETIGPLGLAIDSLVHSASFAAAGALGVAPISVPLCGAVARPSDTGPRQ